MWTQRAAGLRATTRFGHCQSRQSVNLRFTRAARAILPSQNPPCAGITHLTERHVPSPRPSTPTPRIHWAAIARTKLHTHTHIVEEGASANKQPASKSAMPPYIPPSYQPRALAVTLQMECWRLGMLASGITRTLRDYANLPLTPSLTLSHGTHTHIHYCSISPAYTAHPHHHVPYP